MARKLRCTIVEITPSVRTRTFDLSYSGKRRTSSDLLPWADPYIAQLAAILQEEDRMEPMTRLANHAPLLEAGLSLYDPNSELDRPCRNLSWPQEGSWEEKTRLQKRAS